MTADRKVGSFSIVKPSGDPTFDAEVQATLSRIQSSGAELPAPPPMYPDMLGQSLPVGFQCTVREALRMTCALALPPGAARLRGRWLGARASLASVRSAGDTPPAAPPPPARRERARDRRGQRLGRRPAAAAEDGRRPDPPHRHGRQPREPGRAPRHGAERAVRRARRGRRSRRAPSRTRRPSTSPGGASKGAEYVLRVFAQPAATDSSKTELVGEAYLTPRPRRRRAEARAPAARADAKPAFRGVVPTATTEVRAASHRLVDLAPRRAHRPPGRLRQRDDVRREGRPLASRLRDRRRRLRSPRDRPRRTRRRSRRRSAPGARSSTRSRGLLALPLVCGPNATPVPVSASRARSWASPSAPDHTQDGPHRRWTAARASSGSGTRGSLQPMATPPLRQPSRVRAARTRSRTSPGRPVQRVYVDGKPVSPPGFMASAPVFCDTPQGLLLVYTVGVGSGADIIATDTSGGGLRRLTQHEGANTYAACSPDGRLVAFFSTGKRKLGAGGSGATTTRAPVSSSCPSSARGSRRRSRARSANRSGGRPPAGAGEVARPPSAVTSSPAERPARRRSTKARRVRGLFGAGQEARSRRGGCGRAPRRVSFGAERVERAAPAAVSDAAGTPSDTRYSTTATARAAVSSQRRLEVLRLRRGSSSTLAVTRKRRADPGGARLRARGRPPSARPCPPSAPRRGPASNSRSPVTFTTSGCPRRISTRSCPAVDQRLEARPKS